MTLLSKVPTLKEIKNKFKAVNAIIFDMDGTLINSEVLHAKALFDLIGDNTRFNAEELLLNFKGVAEPDVVKMLIQMGILEEGIDLDQFIIQKNLIFKKFLAQKEILATIVYPEIIELLNAIKSEKLSLALVTASERSTTHLFLSELNLIHYFDHIITREDTERSKPDPMPYLLSFSKMDIRPENAVIFEDSDTGYKAATSSGANVLRVNWYEV
jgi:beta-phosphoglucomutase